MSFLRDNLGIILVSSTGVPIDGGASTAPPTQVFTSIYKMNCGSASAVGSFASGNLSGYQSAGTSFDYGTLPTDVSAANAAPAEVYQSVYFAGAGAELKIIIPTSAGVVNGSQHTVRFHFSESSNSYGAGQRVADYFLNGTLVLDDFDIYAAAGYVNNKAIIYDFTVTANSAGITLTAISSVGTSRIAGLEIFRWI